MKLKIIKISIFGFLSFVIILFGLYLYAYLSPSLDIKSSNNISIFDENGTEIEDINNDYWTSINDISPYLIDAVISVEDKNFYKHQGFDYIRIAKAFLENIKSKKIVQGASTISQQYVKNLFLSFDKTWKRKIKEAFLTLELEVHYSKDEILEGYLNTINFGNGNIGITKASKNYFNKEPKDLNLEEAIILAGIPKNPQKYNPIKNYDSCISRAKIVANSMVKNKKINNNKITNLFQNNILNVSASTNSVNNMIMYYKDAVISELKSIDRIPDNFINTKGLKIYTYYNNDAQKYLEEAIKNNIPESEINVASIMVNPSNGGIFALVGGKNYNDSEYNRAISSKRQVGSTMKSFLYYGALENNFLSSTTFTSEKTTFNLENGKIYAPNNYNDAYANKNITMAAAIALSDNIYAVKTNLFLGPEVLIDIAKRTGIKGNLNAVASLALGTSELSMKDYANGYLAFASNGYKKEAHLIKKIVDENDNLLYEFKDDSELVLNQNYTYILNEMLTNTSNSKFKDYTVPSALAIKGKLSNKYAIKTGTTNTDYWICGYNPDALLMVWVGYDDNRNVNSNESIISKNIWADTMENYFKNKDANWYSQPKNVVAIMRDAISGDDVLDSNKAALYYYVKGEETLVFNEEKNKDTN